ncbi:MAG: 2-hydroxyacyl-CoA dehydratase subunit D [Thermodesulfobacteriota bacterium]
MPLNPTAVRQGKQDGRPVIGCFPLYPPLELFHSLGLAPVILWDLKSGMHGTRESDRHLQTYACSVARYLVQWLLAGDGPPCDALFLYNACDTLRNLPEIISTGLLEKGKSIPILRLHIPATNLASAGSALYFQQRIATLIQELQERFSVRFSAAAFRESIRKYGELRQRHRRIATGVARGRIDFDTFAQLCCSGRHLPDDDHLERLDGLLRSLETASPADVGATGEPRVMLSGILPPAGALTRRMEKAGLRIVADDIAALGRAHASQPEPTDDPAAYYRELVSRHISCPTLLPAADRRIPRLLAEIHSRSVEGLIWIGEKYCEYEYFEIPWLEKRLKEIGVPLLQLECGLDDRDNIGPLETRIDAFAELLRQRRTYARPQEESWRLS